MAFELNTFYDNEIAIQIGGQRLFLAIDLIINFIQQFTFFKIFFYVNFAILLFEAVKI